MRNKYKKFIAVLLLLACLMTCLLGFENNTAEAKDSFISGFSQTVFDQDNGLGNTEVNCILQTASGYVWIGTDGGLYRYNGSEFKTFNLWGTDKDDVYFINDLFQDSTGRLWVSTSNYGLFYIKGSMVQHFSNDYYNGVKCVNDVVEGEDGTIYVATAYGLYTLNEEGTGLVRKEEMPVHNIKELAYVNDSLWGIYNGNMIFNMKNDKVREMSSQNIVSEELSCLTGTADGIIYIGTIGSSIIRMTSYQFYDVLDSGVEGINSLKISGSRCYVLADSGAGYFNQSQEFFGMSDLCFDTYFSSMVVDYEGNIWLASNRFGLLLLTVSKFEDFNIKYGIPQNATNCIIETGNRKYIGTDDGLIVTDAKNNPIENDSLAETIRGTGVKDMMVDSRGNIWVTTMRRYGIIKYGRKGDITTFGRSKNLLTNLVNCTYELSDGSIAVGTEEGISIIGRDDVVAKSYSYSSGLIYSNILSLYQSENGDIYAGSDGGGLYVIDKEDNITNYTVEDGLTSNVISCIKEGDQGIWIGTDNGLTLFKDTLRSISNVDFSNNIYDIIITGEEEIGDRTVWLIGSKGILCTTEKELMGTDGISSRYLSTGDGLSKRMTINAHELLSKDKNLYICCSDGVMSLDTENFRQNTVAPRITVSGIDVDGEHYYFDQLGGNLTVPANTQRINISFAVLSFVGRENLKASYMLEGFDEKETVLSGNETMQAVYTNLDGGTYTFHVSAENGDGTESAQSISFVIEKEFSIYERKEFRIAVLVMVLVLVLIVSVVLIRVIKRMKGQNKEIEKLISEHEVAVKSSSAKNDFLANMSNDIKIPINAIVSIAEEIKKDHQEDTEMVDKMDAIISTSSDILGRVDSTIHLARLDSGRETVVNAPYSITTLVCDISDHVINQIEEKPIRFLVDLTENMPDILVGDFEKIKNVLEIILDNAVKYTKEGTITLSVDSYTIETKKDEEKVNLIFSVSDTGVGIREERLEHIFEVYNIADNKKQTGYGGSGISLAIARKLVDIMGGEVDVDSTYGAGSTFTVTLFQDKPAQDIVTGSVDINMVERVSKEEAGKMWAPDVQALLVDDMEISRKVAVGVMKQMEIKTDAASSGVSAIDMVMNHSYDIIFMNVSMPVMSGLDALREMRDLADETIQSVPIIAMTEDAIGEDSDELIKEGFSDVIIKPMDIQSLANMIKRFIPQHKIKYRSNDVATYIQESRYREGLGKLEKELDVAETLERIGGSIEVYNKLITTFYIQNQNAPEELQSLLHKNYRGFRNRIHNIRMGCLNIGAQSLCDALLRMESAINIGNRDYVKNVLPDFTDSLSQMLELLQNYLLFVKEQQGIIDNEGDAAARAEENEKEKSDKKNGEEALDESTEGKVTLTEGVAEPSDEEEIGVIDITDLERLQEAVEGNNIEEAVGVYNEITSHKYGADDTGFLSVLGDSLLAEDMEQIKELLSTYLALKSS